MKKLYSEPEFELCRLSFEKMLNGFNASEEEGYIIRDDDIPIVEE